MSVIKFLFKILLFVAAVAGIITAFWPVAKWYFDASPIKGTDFYYTASLVNHLKNNPLLPSFKWLSIWFSGWPYLSNFPILQYYLILPLVYIFSLISAVKIWMLFSSVIYFIGSYVVFKRLSKNFVLSFLLALGIIYSSGFYGALFWGGSLPSYATQAFLPWIIYSIIAYLDGKDNKFLAVAGILSGLAIFSHPQIVIAYVVPSSVILFIFSFGKKSFFTRFKSLIIYGLLVFLIGLPILYSSLGSAFGTLIVRELPKDGSIKTVIEADSGNIIDRNIADGKPNIDLILVRTNPIFYVLLEIVGIIFISHFILSKNKKSYICNIIPYILIVIFYIFYVYLYSIGISIYHGGWYRLFWSQSLWFGLLISASWGEIHRIYEQQISNKLIFNTGVVFTGILFAAGGFLGLMQIIPTFLKINQNLYSINSSAYPNILNKITQKTNLLNLKQQLVPAWLNPDNKEYRIYIADQTINIWWNALFSMPLARGYLDQPVSPVNRGYTFWMDAAYNFESKSGQNELTGIFNYPQTISLNNVQFLLDWYGVKYFEAGGSLVAYTALFPDMIKNYVKNEQETILETTLEKQTGQRMHFYETKDEFVSPILMGTNSPTIGIISSDQGYETIIRSFADANLGVKQVIPLKLGNNINNISKSDLEAVDVLMVYDYQYNNKIQAFSQLEQFVKQGKKLFIDTGNENKETNDLNLSSIFPMTKMKRTPLGRTWNLNFVNSDLNKEIDIGKFSPPLFDDQEWNFAYPANSSDIKSNSQILLTNYDKPILISQNFGQGKVIWSGMNFPYHVTRFHNDEEVKLWRNIINNLLPVNNTQLPEFTSTYVTDEERKIIAKNSHGILFKEELYPGWTASMKSSIVGKNLKIYAAGPSYPGFMYVHLSDAVGNKETMVTFKYLGSPVNHLLILLSFVISLFLLDQIFFSGKILANRILNSINKINISAFSWWEKDDEK